MSINKKVANLKYLPEVVLVASLSAYLGVLLYGITDWGLLLMPIYGSVALLASFVIVKEEKDRKDKHSRDTEDKEF